MSTRPGSPVMISKHRLEALSDGVFAVVMTLLVLELKLEHLPAHPSNADVGHALAGLARPLLGYAIAFLLTAAFWVMQHRSLSLLAHTSLRHTWFTLAFLFPVTLMPFAAATFVQAVGTGAAMLLYFGNLAVIAALLLAGWLDAKRSGLLLADADPTAVHVLTVRIGSMAIGCVAGAAVGFFVPQFSSFALVLVLVVSRRFARPAAVTV